ncbi:hypothetical protein BX600DRAFT_436984 [Xylariales sp. PMI_506]|nr:hypothetical protein BX600DRAFT_436984 [Xylariales sp. PMI_506]
MEYPGYVVVIVLGSLLGLLVVLGISLQKAMAELAVVTDHRGYSSEVKDCPQPDCPICLASLYQDTTEGLQDVDLETGLSRTSTAYTGSTGAKGGELERLEAQPLDDEILKLKKCQHMFHARCLATWFLRHRTTYYQVVEPSDQPGLSRDPSYVQIPPMAVVPFW